MFYQRISVEMGLLLRHSCHHQHSPRQVGNGASSRPPGRPLAGARYTPHI